MILYNRETNRQSPIVSLPNFRGLFFSIQQCLYHLFLLPTNNYLLTVPLQPEFIFRLQQLDRC